MKCNKWKREYDIEREKNIKMRERELIIKGYKEKLREWKGERVRQKERGRYLEPKERNERERWWDIKKQKVKVLRRQKCIKRKRKGNKMKEAVPYREEKWNIKGKKEKKEGEWNIEN